MTLAGMCAVALAALALNGLDLQGGIAPFGRPDAPAGGEGEDLRGLRLSFAWPEFPGSLEVGDPERVEAFDAALALAEVVPGPSPAGLDDAYYRLVLEHDGGGLRELLVTYSGRIIDASTRDEWAGEELAGLLSQLIAELDQSFFGEPKTWPEVAAHFSVGGRALVRDLETGLTFTVRRHRGDSHADVEPLTREDAAVLKRIYGGEWSWKRRAAVVSVGPLQVAASMNGMPHGWGDIFDNEFVGHFCLHFAGSRVHTSWRVDDGHQLMVLKSSGRLVEELDRASPEEVAKLAVAAVNHQDVVSLRHLAASLEGAPPFEWLFAEVVRPVRHINLIGVRLKEEDAMEARVEVDALVYHYTPDRDRAFRKRFDATLLRESPQGAWRLDLRTLRPLAYLESGTTLSAGADPAPPAGESASACGAP